MATITFTVNDAHLNRVVDAWADANGWPDEATQGETKAQFARRMVAKHIRRHVRQWELNQARIAVVDPGEPDITS